MTFAKVKITHDGNHYIATLPNERNFAMARMSHGNASYADPTYEQFKIFFCEAVKKQITKKKVLEYIQDCFVDVCENIFDIPDSDELMTYYKRYVAALHKRRTRYLRKAYLNDWNYFVTFTYSDAKMSKDEFKRQIVTKLSDLSSHSGWRYMMRWEEGEIGDRVHLHAFLYVPEGKMIGELYQTSHFSTKRRKMEYYTDNTYFNSRFGISEWKKLDNLKNCKGLVNYLAKYMAKDDGKIIYSRGIVDCLEAEIDLEKDILFTYEANNCIKAIVDRFIFANSQLRSGAVRTAFDLDTVQARAEALLPI